MDQQLDWDKGKAQSLENLMVNIDQSCTVSVLRWALNVKRQIFYDLSKIRSNVKVEGDPSVHPTV